MRHEVLIVSALMGVRWMSGVSRICVHADQCSGAARARSVQGA